MAADTIPSDGALCAKSWMRVSAGSPEGLGGVGGYRIARLVGEGATGRVYRATGADGRTVAIKLVRPEAARDPVFRRRFEREVRIAQAIHSPALVPVIATGEHEGVPFLVQPFMAGGSLADRLAHRGRLEIREILDITGAVADGLSVLAGRGLVHRDVKPPNILLDEDGSARLTDFGLVRDTAGTVLTRVGHAIGSTHYMAPEQIKDGETVTGATDVYALGCVVYECLAGRPPFGDRRGLQVLWAHLNDPPADPCADRSDAPPGLGAAVLRALAKEPSERPHDAPDYILSVARVAGIETSAAGPRSDR